MTKLPRRMRRLRKSETLRSMVRETRLVPADFVYPLFVVEDSAAAGPVASMPGVCRHTIDDLPRELESIAGLGIPAVILFWHPPAQRCRRHAGIGPRRRHPPRDPSHQGDTP